MSRSILKDVSKAELLQMREQGMTNRDIANAIGCGYQTILRAIGKNPAQPKRNYYSARAGLPAKHEEEQEIYEAALAVQRSAYRLKGVFGEYEIPDDGKTLEITAPFSATISAEEIETFIKELQAIARNIGKVDNKLEMW